MRTRNALTVMLIVLLLTTLSNVANIATVAQSDAAQPVTATTHPIEYQIGGPPSMVNDGSLDYFKAHGFSVVHLVVPDQGTYQAELNKIKSLGMKPIIDIEVPIWNGGQYKTTSIATYASYFQSLKAAGWEYVASEGGRSGDVGYLMQFFKGYVNYNCDQCGLWGSNFDPPYPFYKQPGTVANSWESYYTTEWPYIQQGAKEAAALGKQNGILAGTWANNNGNNQILANSLNGGSPSYKSMLDWSYANGCGFNHFHVWCGLDQNALNDYKARGFEQIVSQLQVTYPATKTPTSMSLSVSNPTPTIGQSITLTGILKSGTSAIANAPVYLHTSRDNVNWVLVSNTPATTSTNGAYTRTWTPPAGTSYFRTYYPGSSYYREAFSPAVKITAVNPTTFSMSTTTTTPTTSVAFTLTGTIKSGTSVLTNKPVHLESHKKNSDGTWTAWANLADTYKHTDSAGKVSSTRTLSTTGAWQYRWHYNGTSTYAAARSSAVTETVKKPTTLTITSSTAPRYNVAFTLSGTLKSGTAGLSGLSVHLERKVGSGSWSNVDGTTKTTTSTGGIPPVSQTMASHGTYSYRWHFTGTGTYQAGYSPTKTFTV